MAVVINEVLGSTTGTDAEFVELFGPPGASLDGLSLIVVENDEGTSSGTIDARLDLAGHSLGTNGFFLAGSPQMEAVYGVTPDLGFSNNTIENSSYTVALVRTSGLGAVGETITGSETVLDSLGVTDGDVGDAASFSAPVIGPDGAFLPAGGRRAEDGVDTDTPADWLFSDFGNDAGVNTPTAGGAAPVPETGVLATIPEIQGAGHTSPLVGQTVTTQGIVTAVDSSGFYVQDATGDGDIATSDAIFVFTSSAPGVAVGDELEITGEISEFTPGGTATGNLSQTQMAFPDQVTVLSSGNPLPAAQILGQGGRVPVPDEIDDDAFAAFDASLDGIDFLESLEALLVTAQDMMAVAGTNRFGEIFGVVDQGADATGLSGRGTLNISPDDFNPEKIQIDFDSGLLPGFDFPDVNVGDLLGDVTGVVNYDFGNFQIHPTEAFGVAPAGLAPEVSGISGGADKLTVASYNVLNLDPNDDDDGDGIAGNGGDDTDVANGRFTAIARQVVDNMNGPDIIGLQEIQDNNGTVGDEGSGVVAADETLQLLIDEIAAAGGPSYAFIDNTFITEDASGGFPGGNIRTAFLYDPERVSVDAGSIRTVGGQGPGEAFEGARLPLVVDFGFNGETVTVVNNHFSSKGGSAPILGVEQPFEDRQEDLAVNGSLDERRAQAQAVNDFVDDVLGGDANANVMVLGDLNEFEFLSPLKILEGSEALQGDGSVAATGSAPILTNLVNSLPEDERYSFVFQGNSQSLDHILVSDNIAGNVNTEFDIVNINSEFADTSGRASDHDPLLASLEVGATALGPFTLELLHFADQEAGAAAVGDAPRLSGVLNALRAQDLGDDGVADNTLTLSSGDAVLPGLFFSAGEAAFGSAGIGDMQIQNELGVQAMTLGNHEFDEGPGVLAGLIDGTAAGDFTDPAFDGTALDDLDFAGTAFPYLSSNLDFSTEPALAPLEVAGGQAPQAATVTSSTVIDVNGAAVGVVGATTPTLGAISSPGSLGISPSPFGSNPTAGQLDALAAIIQVEVDALLAANTGMDKVILAAHMQDIDIERGLAARLTDVDILIGGGSNTRLFDADDRARDGDSVQGQYPEFITNAGGTETVLVNTDGSYKYVGRLVIEFDENGEIVPESYDETVSGAYATDAQGVADLNAADLIDPEVQAIADATQAEIIETESNVFGVSDVFLNGERSGTFAGDDPDGVRTQETNLGNLTADANLAAAQAIDGDVVVSIKNGGGIRASIGQAFVPAGGSEVVRQPNEAVLAGDGSVIKPEGGISQNDIQTTLAFNNGLTALTLTRQELADVLEHGVSALPGVAGAFPQVSGLRFSFDDERPVGARIEDASVVDADGEVIAELVRDGQIAGDATETFRVVTLGFLAAPRFDADGNFTGGGDGYPFPNTNTDPAAGETGDPDVVARVNLVSFEQEGVQTGDATFADDGTEQDALAEYLDDNFADAETAFDQADVGPASDRRIVDLDFAPAPEGSRILEASIVRTFQGDAEDPTDPEGASEVVAHENGKLFVTNGNLDRIDVFDIAEGPAAGGSFLDLSGIPGFDGVQSVAVRNGIVAAAVEIAAVADGDTVTPSNGVVAFFDGDSGDLLDTVEVGVLPDAVSFTPDGSRLLVTNEAEFNAESDVTVDASGSVSVITVSEAEGSYTFEEVSRFGPGDLAGIADFIEAEGIRIDPGLDTVAQHEPEFVTITADGQTAYVSVQENNWIAEYDVASGEITGGFSAGTVDFSDEGADFKDDEVIDINQAPVHGLRQPDAIKVFEIDGRTLIATANEGDGRGDAFSFDEDDNVTGTVPEGDEARVSEVLAAAAAGVHPGFDESVDTSGLERLKISPFDGDTDGDGDIDEITTFGGRSFTIFDTDGNVVFDSGADFARIIAERAPERFLDDDGESGQNRADAKGSEPEAIEIGRIGGKVFAFIGLERDSGIMIYDVTDPENATFVDYLDGFESGNIAPEIIEFIPAADSSSGEAQIAVSYEESGTTVVYDLDLRDGPPVRPTPNPDLLDLGAGPNTVEAFLDDLFDDVFDGFGEDDSIRFRDEEVGRDQLRVDAGSGVIGVDRDGDDNPDGSFTLNGDFTGGDFMAVADGGDTAVTFESFLPSLEKGRQVDEADVNGVVNQEFLTGDGATQFRVTLDSEIDRFAGFDNAVGVYEVDGAGAIVDARLLFDNANDAEAGSRLVDGVEDGHRLGFFVVQDGADAVDPGDSFRFVDADGATATVGDGADISLLVNGEALDATVFHSFASDLNADGLQHALSGVEEGGRSISMGFEDLTGGGDRDYEDVVFEVEAGQFLA